MQVMKPPPGRIPESPLDEAWRERQASPWVQYTRTDLHGSGKAQGFGSYGPHLQRMVDQEKKARWHDWNSCPDRDSCAVHGDPGYRRMRARLEELDPDGEWPL